MIERFKKAIKSFGKRWALSIDDEIDWNNLADNLRRHRVEVGLAEKGIAEGRQTAAFEIAITDLITEKAVDHLSRRSTVYYTSAWLLLLLTGAAIGLAIWWLDVHTIAFFIKQTSDLGKFSSNQVVVMSLARSVSMGALFAAAPIILGGLSFSYFHEATAAYHQRHAIRFGRLWVDLQLSGTNPAKPSLRDFRRAFGLDSQYDTSFRRLKLPKNAAGNAADVFKALASVAKEFRQKEASDTK